MGKPPSTTAVPAGPTMAEGLAAAEAVLRRAWLLFAHRC